MKTKFLLLNALLAVWSPHFLQGKEIRETLTLTETKRLENKDTLQNAPGKQGNPIRAESALSSIAPALRSFSEVGLTKAEKTVEQVLNDYLRPVEFSKQGLSTFFKHCFLTTLYTERFLPACWAHIIDFIKYGTDNHKDRAFINGSLSLFQQRLSACSWVNPYTLLTFLEQAPELLNSYTRVEQKTSQEKELDALKKELQSSLMKNFGLLKKDPNAFLDTTCRKLLEITSKDRDSGSVRELQNRITQLMHSALSKLIWNPREKLDIWYSVTAIGTRLQILYDADLIAHVDDLNLLIWELLNRFNYFIDCAGSQLPPAFYKAIQDDVTNKKHGFLLLSEREPEFTSKEDFLLQTVILKGMVKTQAYENGITSDIIA